ncbi:MAG: helix-turn-helix domain-containing protein [Waterburya sp.]
MLVKGYSSLAQLQQLSIFQDLAIAQLKSLVRCSYVKEYQQDEIIMHEGDRLNIKLPYYQIARSIGITYEECVRLFKKLKGTVIYKRGGTIIVQDWKQLAAASGIAS